jgi:Helix-turn-helix domain
VKDEPDKDSQDSEMGWIKAIDHPLRKDVLAILQSEVSSPNRMANALKEPLANVSYHTKVLFESDCIELVKTVPRRGAVEHFYRAKPGVSLGSRQWQAVPASIRGDMTVMVLNDFMSRAFDALEKGTLHGGDGGHLSARSLRLDEAAWKSLLEIVQEAEGRVERTFVRKRGLEAVSFGRKA